MTQPRLTTKHSHWKNAADVTEGQYFKYMNRWYLALRNPHTYTQDTRNGRMYAYAIHAMNSDGTDQWVDIHRLSDGDAEQVEGYAEGKRPGPFTPATLRRKAKMHDEEAARQFRASALKLALARRLENDTIAG